MKAQILTLNTGCTTEEICKQIAIAMKAFNDECFINVVREESSIFYCATLTNSKVNCREAEIIYRALEITRLFEREQDFLGEDNVDRIEPIYEEIKQHIRTKRIYKLPKVTLLMEDLMDTYCKGYAAPQLMFS